MAQEIKYWQNDIAYEEGPFVTVCVRNGVYRVECEVKGHFCPALPDTTIYRLLEMSKYSPNGKREDVNKSVDFLNNCVQSGRIILDSGMWRTQS